MIAIYISLIIVVAVVLSATILALGHRSGISGTAHMIIVAGLTLSCIVFGSLRMVYSDSILFLVLFIASVLLLSGFLAMTATRYRYISISGYGNGSSQTRGSEIDSAMASDAYVRKIRFYMKHNLARGCWEKQLGYALKANPGNIDAHVVLAQVYISRSDTDAAIKILEKALSIDPHSQAARDLLDSLKPRAGSVS